MKAPFKILEIKNGELARTHEVSTRTDLGADNLQDALADCHDGKCQLFCACAGALTNGMALGSRDPSAKHGRRVVFRRKPKAHARTCASWRILGDPTSLPLSTGLFAEPKSRREYPASVAPSEPLLHESQGDAAKRTVVHRTFSEFCSDVCANAALDAFCSANPPTKGPPSVQPSAGDFFSAIHDEWDRPRFVDQLDAHGAAARENNGRLVCGVILDPAVEINEEMIVRMLLWQGNHWISHAAVASRAEWCDGQRSLHVEGVLLPPPYLAVAVLDVDGNVRRLWQRPIYWDGVHIPLTIDSGNERVRADLLQAEGATVFKPQRGTDFGELLHRLGLLDTDADFPDLEPDFIFWHPDEPTVPRVNEVIGYRKSVNRDDYHAALDRKEIIYLQPGRTWRYVRTPAHELPRNHRCVEISRPAVEGSYITRAVAATLTSGLSMFRNPTS